MLNGTRCCTDLSNNSKYAFKYVYNKIKCRSLRLLKFLCVRFKKGVYCLLELFNKLLMAQVQCTVTSHSNAYNTKKNQRRDKRQLNPLPINFCRACRHWLCLSMNPFILVVKYLSYDNEQIFKFYWEINIINNF